MAEKKSEIEEKKEKPGYKTTEFYLTLLAMAMAMLMASGVLGEGGLDVTIVSFALAALSKAGYDFNRAYTKRGESRERASIASLASIASIAASNDNQNQPPAVAAGKD